MSSEYWAPTIVRQTADELWSQCLEWIKTDGELINPVGSLTSPSVGQKTIELRGVRLVLTNPRARYIASQGRPLNTGFCIGNFLNYLGETDLVSQIAYYNPLAMRFSDNQEILHGAYSPRTMWQVKEIVNVLKRDLYSRRGVVDVWLSDMDCGVESKDLPCPIAFQCLVRNGALEMHMLLRSQNMIMVFPYDIFLFTMLQEWIATMLGVKLGPFSQYVVSCHYYEQEKILVDAVLKQAMHTIEMQAMTPLDDDRMQELLAKEQAWRNWGLHPRLMGPVPGVLDDDPYWSGILRLLVMVATCKHDGTEILRSDDLLQQCCGLKA